MKELSLHITDLCNYRCRFCVWGESLRRSGEGVAWSELEDFLVAHRDQGFERVNLHGGEPTLRADLFRLLGLVRSLGYPTVSLQTNGSRLADRSLAGRLIQAGVSLFVVSIHGPTPDVHDAHSGVRGSLGRALRGIDAVWAGGGRIRTNTVVTRLNYRHLAATAALVADHGADHVNISALMPSGPGPLDESLMPSYATVAPYVRAMVEAAEGRGVMATLEGFPWCVVPGMDDHMLSRRLAEGQQVKCLIRGAVWLNHDEFVEDHCKAKQPSCADCRYAGRCPGAYTAYVAARGWGEFQPVRAPSKNEEGNDRCLAAREP